MHRTSFLTGMLVALLLGLAIFVTVRAFSHQRLQGWGPPPFEQRREEFRGISEQLGMTGTQLREELLKGKSMMDIARERGVELKVPSHFFDEDRHQQFLSRMAERIGITEEELRQELADGKTLLDVAGEHGIELEFPRRGGMGTPPPF